MAVIIKAGMLLPPVFIGRFHRGFHAGRLNDIQFITLNIIGG
ncbi:hypothetical protein EPYR_00463 [Erwinia pyrifoliae DSM 12163]|nr:hypothetical protein EPYR_00463 [Erwinia pyrifoliae DSM 12163]